MTEFNASGNPRFPFELAPKVWDRRVFLFTKAEAERWTTLSEEQRQELIIRKKAKLQYRQRNTMAFQDKSR